MSKLEISAYLQTYRGIRINVTTQTGLFYAEGLDLGEFLTLAKIQTRIDFHLKKLMEYKQIEAIIVDDYGYSYKIENLKPIRADTDYYGGPYHFTAYHCVDLEDNYKGTVMFAKQNGGSHDRIEALKNTPANLERLERIEKINKEITDREQVHSETLRVLKESVSLIFNEMDHWLISEIEVKTPTDSKESKQQ